MPRLIEVECAEQCELDECITGIAATRFDPACGEGITAAALWLRKLTNNRTFLGDLLIEEIKPHHRDTAVESGYGPQAIVLSRKCNDVFLRANIWPSEHDHCFQASGAQTFVYGIPHDHNFSFLTSGYFGPGYLSDYYEYDYESVAGYEGERPKLRFIERSQLGPGKLMLYRAHVDIHSQIPPESLSVSLNVMHVDPAQNWFDQYGFDLEQGAITSVLSPTRPRRSCGWRWRPDIRERWTLPNTSAAIIRAIGCGWRASRRAPVCSMICKLATNCGARPSDRAALC